MPLNKTKKAKKTANAPSKEDQELLNKLFDHYKKGVSDMEQRKTRKNGWDDVVNVYMDKLPENWPYTSKVTDPRVRTTVLEKTGRLLNSKLQGRLVPREGSDVVKARINNAVLEFQWDQADNGGSMIEKVAKADQYARIFGTSFSLVYWDTLRNTNEMKVLDPRDVFPDYTADHIGNAKWCQVREYTTLAELEARGYNTKRLEERIKEKYNVTRDNLSMVKENRGIEDRLGQDPANPVVEIITEWTAKDGNKPGMRHVFLPRYNELLESVKNPYDHGKIPIAQLRYYPLGDEMYGESEVEPVIRLQRAINAVLCGFIDTMNLATRPPIKILSGESRTETMEYGPGARWIVNNIQSGTEVRIGDGAIQAFNNTYPSLVAAFNTAMGDQSLGVSNLLGKGEDKTATEVNSLQQQQNSRDQYNQLYLSEFLKDVMMQWLANNKQYLFDDPTQHTYVLKIVGRDNIKELEQLGLGDYTQKPEDIEEISNTIIEAGGVDKTQLADIFKDTQVPKYPVITNPSADSPEDYDIQPKLKKMQAGHEAELLVTPSDVDGTFDYIPDVKSMAAGAGSALQQGRKQAFELLMNDKVQAGLQLEGQQLKMSELVTTILEDAGIRDADSLLEQARQAPLEGAQQPFGAAGIGGLPAPQGVPIPAGGPGMAQPQAIQEGGDLGAGLPI